MLYFANASYYLGIEIYYPELVTFDATKSFLLLYYQHTIISQWRRKGSPGGAWLPFEAWTPFGPHLSFTDIKQNAVYG